MLYDQSMLIHGNKLDSRVDGFCFIFSLEVLQNIGHVLSIDS